MSESAPKPQPIKSPEEQIAFMVGMFSIPAMSVMVFTRHRLGIRQISLNRQILAAGFLLFVAIFFDYGKGSIFAARYMPQSQPSFGAVGWFVFASFAMATWQKRDFKKRLSRGDFWHSYSMGISWLEYALPMRGEWVRQYVEPFLVMFIGMMFSAKVSGFLGWWIFMAGIGISICEGWAMEQQFKMLLNTIDQICEGEAQLINHAAINEAKNEFQSPRPRLEQSAGIPTGLAPDIEAQIQKRRARKPITEDLAN